jgi:hypothetical protein
VGALMGGCSCCSVCYRSATKHFRSVCSATLRYSKNSVYPSTDLIKRFLATALMNRTHTRADLMPRSSTSLPSVLCFLSCSGNSMRKTRRSRVQNSFNCSEFRCLALKIRSTALNSVIFPSKFVQLF